MNDTPNGNDHDLLIELRTEMKGVREDIKNMTGSVSKTLADHEIRIRALEQAGWKLAGMASLASSAITLIGAALVQHFIK